MSFDPKDFAGSHCGCRYQQDYRPTLGRFKSFTYRLILRIIPM